MTTAAPKAICNERRKFQRRLCSHWNNCVSNLLYPARFMSLSGKQPTRKRRSERLSDSDSYEPDSSGCFMVVIAGLVWLIVIIFSNIR